VTGCHGWSWDHKQRSERRADSCEGESPLSDLHIFLFLVAERFGTGFLPFPHNSKSVFQIISFGRHEHLFDSIGKREQPCGIDEIADG
jgi:hypothetical protein